MKKFDVSVFENGAEVYDCEIIEAYDDEEAVSVAQDMLYAAGYTYGEVVDLEFVVKEIED